MAGITLLADLIREANPTDPAVVAGLDNDALVAECDHNLTPEHYRLAAMTASGTRRVTAIAELREMMGLPILS